MARSFRNDIQSYSDAEKVLNGKDAVKIGHNTMLVRNLSGISVILHSTAIVSYYQDGSIVLNSGGYRTNTTAHRLHGLVPHSVGLVTRKGWTVDGKPFVDRMIVKG